MLHIVDFSGDGVGDGDDGDDGVGDGDDDDNCLPVMPEKARGTVGQPEAE